MTEHNEYHAFKADEIPCQEISDPAVLSKTPLVSVKMITYNHELYIAQAIEGVLMQQTDFPIELIIGEDCSTDRTREIVIDYQKKHPDIIRVVTSEGNVGARKNSLRTNRACRGKYIAFCEGDDYWTDPCKLQKQVDFLEVNENYGVCFHHVDIVNSENQLIGNPSRRKKNFVYTQRDFFISNKRETHTCSSVFKKECLPDPIPSWFNEVCAGDKFLKVMLTEKHKAFVMKDTMACYRKHDGGIWSSMNIDTMKRKMDNDLKWMIKIYGNKYSSLIPYIKDKHEYDFVSYYLAHNNKRRAWISLLKMFKYPDYIVKNPILTLKKFIRLLVPVYGSTGAVSTP